MEGLKRRKNVAVKHITSFTEWTSTHAIPQIRRSHHFCPLLFWTILFLIGSVLIVWQTTLLLFAYWDYDLNVQIDTKEGRNLFPAVTICNLNPYRKSVIYKQEKVQRLMETYEYSLKKLTCNKNPDCIFERNVTFEDYQEKYRFKNLQDPSALQARAKRILILELAGTDVSKAIMDFNEFFQGCAFETNDCDPEHWNTFLNPVLGACFTFNNQSQVKSMRIGSTYGLRVIVKTNSSEFIATSDTGGFRVFVHDQSEYPFPEVSGVSVGVGAGIGIKAQWKVDDHLAKPYSKCDNTKPDGYLYPLEYTAEACQRTYFQVQMVKNCNCYDPYYPQLLNSTGTPACSVEKNFDCWLQQSNITLPYMSCQNPCVRGSYDFEASDARWPSGSISYIGKCEAGMYGNKTCVEVFTEEGALIDVFYGTLSYEVFSEEGSYKIVNFLADFGGQIGLWLGMGIVSIVEFFILAFQLLFTGLHPKFGEAFKF
uniref:Uncharacterized protein n=1 Tax=Panagrolaimus davidi TaxID=227884 RepID=A0A914QHQ7_9BILA